MIDHNEYKIVAMQEIKDNIERVKQEIRIFQRNSTIEDSAIMMQYALELDGILVTLNNIKL